MLTERDKHNHKMSFWVQVGAAAFIAMLFYLISKFKPSLKKEASEILGVGDKKNGTMQTLYNYKTKYTGNLDKDVFDFIHEAEGGLSKNPSDSAAKYSKVTPKEPYHTNAGITRATFDKYATKFGFKNDYATFLNMPVALWTKIYNEVYYKPFKDITDDRLFNIELTNWAWGSGPKGALLEYKKFLKDNGVNSMEELEKKYSKAKIFEMLVEERMRFFREIASNDTKGPNGEDKDKKFLDGWLNRQANFYNIFSEYLK